MSQESSSDLSLASTSPIKMTLDKPLNLSVTHFPHSHRVERAIQCQLWLLLIIIIRDYFISGIIIHFREEETISQRNKLSSPKSHRS